VLASASAERLSRRFGVGRIARERGTKVGLVWGVAAMPLHILRHDVVRARIVLPLAGLIALDYVVANRVNIRTMESVKAASFRVNATLSRELREAVYPSRRGKPDTGRRRRRS
jgi:hypothetical protein